MLAAMKPAVPLLHLDHVNAASVSLQYSGIPSPISMPPTKRPKLSLQTNSLSVSYGSLSSTASNKIENMSTATPTTLNTFSNIFDLTIRPSPNSATASPGVLQRAKDSTPTPFRRKTACDLNLPLGVRPILKNRGLFHESRRGSLTTSASPRTTRRVFFPPAKKVSFVPIDEEIVTHTYVARHIDLSSSEDESNSDSSRERLPVEQTQAGDEDTPKTASENHEKRGSREDSRGRQSVQRSPSNCRSKRKKRRWEWTIENLDKTEGEALIQAQKSEKPGQEDECRLSTTTPSVESVDAQVFIDAPPQQSGYDTGPDAGPQNEGGGLAVTTTPNDDPPDSPWMIA